jgi:hypothetical protein
MNSVPTPAIPMPHPSIAAECEDAADSARAEATMRAGRLMIFAGVVVTILGVVLYSLACFAGGMDADMGDILFRNAVPFARAMLGVLGLGTLVWLAGSFVYLRGALDADEEVEDGGL